MSRSNIEISVIITAHNRRKFLKEAISSALNQKYDREKYEVIVVKNFEDQEIDGFMKEKNVNSLHTEEEKLGAKLKLGIEESKGWIICFLEDDDKFHEDKLRKVYQSFIRYKDLTFYRNNRIAIDEEGKVLLTPDVWEEEYFSNYNEKVYTSLIKRNAWFNSSSICVRKDEIVLSQLEQINLAPDIYLFSSVLINRKPILLDHTPLTYYRIHYSNTSSYFYTDCKYKGRQVDDLSKIYEWSDKNMEFGNVFYYLYFIIIKWNYDIVCKDKRLVVLAEGLKMLKNPFLPTKLKAEYVGASFLNLFLHSFVKNYLIKRSKKASEKTKWVIDLKETEIS